MIVSVELRDGDLLSRAHRNAQPLFDSKRTEDNPRRQKHLFLACIVPAGPKGGIRLQHLEQLTRAGADILVVGSAIFYDDDPKARLSEMLRLVSAPRAMSKA